MCTRSIGPSRFYLGVFSLLFCFLANGQEVKTFVPANSGIDEALLRTESGLLFGNGWVNGSLYSFDRGQSEVLSDQLTSGSELCEGSNGELFITDNRGNRIFKYDPTGKTMEVINVTIPRPAGMIRIPGSDSMLVTSVTSDQVFIMSPDGKAEVFLEDRLLNSPVTLVYDEEGNLYVGNYTNGAIAKFDSDLNGSLLCGLPTRSLGHFARIGTSLLVTGVFSHEIYLVNTQNGDWSIWAGSLAGSQNGSLDEATFNGPNGIVSSGDTVYVSDYNTQEVRMITGVRQTLSSWEEQSSEVTATVFPNPSSGSFQIHLNNQKKVKSIELLDAHGVPQTVKWHQRKSTIEVHTPQMPPPGQYYLKVLSEKSMRSFPVVIN